MCDNIIGDDELENMSFDEIMNRIFSTIPYYNQCKLSELKIAQDTVNPSGAMRSGTISKEEYEAFLKAIED